MSSAVDTASSTPPPVVDLEAALAPAPGENPAGESLQYAGLHDEIREARRSEDNLEQGDWKREIKVADWRQVVGLATKALTTQTKDLQICAWLAEGLVKLHGFAGLRDGLKLMRGLLEQYWEHVYPEIDEGDLEARANSLSWLDRQVASAIKEVPITNSNSGVDYNYLQWEESNQFDIPESLDGLTYDQVKRIEEMRQRATEERKVTGEDWRKAKNATRRAFYEEIYALLNQSWDELQVLDRVMDEKFERQTPGLGELKKSLEDVRSVVTRLVKEKRVLEPDPLDEQSLLEEGEAAAEGEGGRAAGGVAGPIRTRQEALRRLAEIADYFRVTEPHSPVSYLVQRAVKWGQMPLETWLRDVIKDGSVLENLRETLGLNTGTEGEK